MPAMTSLASIRCLPLAVALLGIGLGSSAVLAQSRDGGTTKKSDRLPADPLGGTNSLTETFGDWTLRCAVVGADRRCLIGQTRADVETGKRVFVMELHPPENGETNGVLLMPHGLALTDGLQLKIDGRNLGQAVPFESCLTGGCVVPLTLPEVATNAMRAGTELSILSTYAGDAQPTAFTVSLDGLAAALDRLASSATK